MYDILDDVSGMNIDRLDAVTALLMKEQSFQPVSPADIQHLIYLVDKTFLHECPEGPA